MFIVKESAYGNIEVYEGRKFVDLIGNAQNARMVWIAVGKVLAALSNGLPVRIDSDVVQEELRLLAADVEKHGIGVGARR